MVRKTSARYFILVPILLAMTLAAGCGGGGDSAGIIGLAQGRWGHTATLLEDGRVLVVGGQETPSGKIATAEIYDLTGTWSSAGSMSEARGEAHTATLLADGRVLVVGDSSSVDVYDPSAGEWSTTGSMSEERLEHTATLLSDGRVLVAGGIAGRRDLDSAEVYDPSTGQWSSTGDMSEKRQSHKAVLLGDGKVLVLGRNTAEIYDPSTGSWFLTSKLGRWERSLGRLYVNCAGRWQGSDSRWCGSTRSIWGSTRRTSGRWVHAISRGCCLYIHHEGGYLRPRRGSLDSGQPHVEGAQVPRVYSDAGWEGASGRR